MGAGGAREVLQDTQASVAFVPARVGRLELARRRANGSTHVPTFVLDQAVDPNDIVEIDLRTTFGGGAGGDNWNMKSVSIKAIVGGADKVIFKPGSNRFTGDNGLLCLTK
jgi:hypothetical protein